MGSGISSLNPFASNKMTTSGSKHIRFNMDENKICHFNKDDPSNAISNNDNNE